MKNIPTPPPLYDAPYVPTTHVAVREMLTLANVTETDVVYDLGCGDGRIVIAAAKHWGARGVGIDIDPQRIREANQNARKAGVEMLVRFAEGNLFQANIAEATVVTLFLWPQMNRRLREKFLSDLKPGSRIVSNTFDLGDWKPDQAVWVRDPAGEARSPLSQQLYLWIIPPCN